MREALTPEQVQQLLVEIDAWKVRNRAEKLQKWQEAEIASFEQIVEVEAMELYIVEILFPAGHYTSFLLKREDARMESTMTYTYYAPDFTHPLQGR